jgi:hypothetical protein
VDCISKYYIANTLGRDVSFVIPDPVKVKGYDMKILDSVEKGLELQPPKCLDNVVPPLAKTSETMIVSDQDACVHGYQESELVVGLEGVQCQEYSEGGSVCYMGSDTQALEIGGVVEVRMESLDCMYKLFVGHVLNQVSGELC